jgi:hypothetical protein
MRKVLLSLTAAAAFASAASLAPSRADAMTVGTAAGVRGALEDTSMIEDVRYVCSHRYYSSRRNCWWQPDRYRSYRPYHRRWRRW